ncbi:MAG: DUF4198 domain-containing protein [Thermodesulfobacteria bacterium]|nr:DUF4198 domain-containing protein [Thermodesulfobacteriota bacterium]
MRKRVLLTILLVFLAVGEARAFFLTAIQEGEGYALKGKEVRWDIFRSEPFQGVIFDLKAPRAMIYAPDEKPRLVALRRLQIFDYASGKKRFAWQARFIAQSPGDHYLVLTTDPTLVPGAGEVWREWVKVPLHVEQRKGWERTLGLRVEIVPLTRPYGLVAGSVFKARVLFEGEPASGIRVQMVPYLGVYLRPEELPLDENERPDVPLMYGDLLTDEGGCLTVSFPHPGWWLLSAIFPAGNFTLGQQKFPFYLRASFWLYVKAPYTPPETAPRIRPETE